MIKSEQGRRNDAAESLDRGNGNGNGHSNGTLESIPEVVAPPLLARGARNAMMERGGDGNQADEDGDENEGGADGEGGERDGDVGTGKKRKRNKPTLSCGECVERKTKCDRGRPHCLACIRRGTECVYMRRAEAIEDSTRQSHIRRVNAPPKPKHQYQHQRHNHSIGNYEATLASPTSSSGYSKPSPGNRRRSSADLLLSTIPHSNPSASNIYGIGSEHPFSNYWTLQGGLGEVVGVLPARQQADILLDKWFECVDPIYPMIQKQRFYVEYEHFWSLDTREKSRSDGSFLALVFIMLAMGTQFISLPQETSRSETSEFYASASHQALRMSSYLNRPTIRTIQAMVLMTYFLLNDNHPSDGWAFAGILSRQSYAMGLNRDPAILNPSFTPFQRQERRRLWQAVLIQDTFMTVLLKLPPTATHADVDLTSFDEDERAAGPGYEENDNNDVGYIRGMWTLALLVQETISSPRSLSLPMAPTPRHRTQLLSRFKAAYRSFPDIFRAWDESSICDIAKYNKRLVLQTLFLTSNYYHCLMLVQAEEDAVEGSINLRGAMEAAHEAIKSFFVLHALLESEASVWWVFCHRAFTEALVLADLLRKAHQILVSSPSSQSLSPSSPTSPTSPAHHNPHYSHSHSNSQSSQPQAQSHSESHFLGLSNPLPGPVDPLFAKARTDVLRMVEILELNQAENDVCRTRVEVLRNYL